MSTTLARLSSTRPLLAVLCGVCLLGFVNTANRLIYEQSLVAAADRDLATRIMERAALLGCPSHAA